MPKAYTKMQIDIVIRYTQFPKEHHKSNKNVNDVHFLFIFKTRN